MTEPTASPHEIEAALTAHRDAAAQRAANADAKLAQLEAQQHRLLVAGSLTAATELTDELNRVRNEAVNARVEVDAVTLAVQEVNLKRQHADAHARLAEETGHLHTRRTARQESAKRADAAIATAHTEIAETTQHAEAEARHAYQVEELTHFIRTLDVGQAEAEAQRTRFVRPPNGQQLIDANPSWRALTMVKNGTLF